MKHIPEGSNWGLDIWNTKKLGKNTTTFFDFDSPQTNTYITPFLFSFLCLTVFLKKVINFINKRQYNQRFDSFLQM